MKESEFMYKGYETLKYQVLDKKGNIEIRTYQPSLIAEVDVRGERKQSINEGFRILAAYIFGSNLSKQKIKMTTPVVQMPLDNSWKVRFMMPSQYSLDNLPRTKDSRIHFLISPVIKMIVIRFSGLITDDNLSQHLKLLQDYIKQNNLAVGKDYRYAFYDAPWTLPFMRRNEIAYPLS